MKNKNTAYGISSLFLTTLLYSSFGVLSRNIGFQIPIFFQSWTRGLLNSLILIAIIIIFKQWVKIQKKDIFWILARPLAGVVSFTGSFIAYNFMPIGTAYFIIYGASTIAGYITGSILFREKLTPIKILSLIISLVGLGLIFSTTFELKNNQYMIIALVAGIGSALWTTLSKKISNIYTNTQMNFFDIFIFFISCLLISLVLHEPWTLPTFTNPWIANVLLAFMFISTGQLVVFGFKYVSAQIGSLIMLSEVLFGILIGFFVYKESLSFLTIVGGILVLIAIILPELNLKKLK